MSLSLAFSFRARSGGAATPTTPARPAGGPGDTREGVGQSSPRNFGTQLVNQDLELCTARGGLPSSRTRQLPTPVLADARPSVNRAAKKGPASSMTLSLYPEPDCFAAEKLGKVLSPIHLHGGSDATCTNNQRKCPSPSRVAVQRRLFQTVHHVLCTSYNTSPLRDSATQGSHAVTRLKVAKVANHKSPGAPEPLPAQRAAQPVGQKLATSTPLHQQVLSAIGTITSAIPWTTRQSGRTSRAVRSAWCIPTAEALNIWCRGARRRSPSHPGASSRGNITTKSHHADIMRKYVWLAHRCA